MDNVQTVVADVGDAASVKRIFENNNPVDHIFIPAGSMAPGKILDTHPDKFRQSLEERIFGPLYVVRAAVPKMPKSGSITLISSISVDHPIPGITMTTVGVAAARTLTAPLKKERLT